MFICSVPFVESICLRRESNFYFKIEQNLGTIVLKVLYGDYSLKDKFLYSTALWKFMVYEHCELLKASASAAMCLLYLKNHSTVANCFMVFLRWIILFESRSISEACGFIGSLFVCSGTLYHCCSNMIRRQRNQIRQMHMVWN